MRIEIDTSVGSLESKHFKQASSYMKSILYKISVVKSGATHTTPGNRSDIIPSNMGISGAKNLGKLTSRIARNTNTDSSSSRYRLFKLPAALSTAITALIP